MSISKKYLTSDNNPDKYAAPIKETALVKTMAINEKAIIRKKEKVLLRYIERNISSKPIISRAGTRLAAAKAPMTRILLPCPIINGTIQITAVKANNKY